MFFCCRKKLYDPSDPRDAEELLNYLEELSSDDEGYQLVNGCRRLDLVLFPPADGNESDVDDASSDDDTDHGIRDIGKGILRQPMEVIAVHSVEKNDVRLNVLNETNIIDVGSSDDGTELEIPAVRDNKKNCVGPNELQERSIIDADTSDEDNISLDILAKKMKFDKPRKNKTEKITKSKQKKTALDKKRNKTIRSWTEQQLKGSSNKERPKIENTTEPAVVQKIRDENLSPIDVFKMFFTEDFVKEVCTETQKYASFKGKHDFIVSTREMYIYFGILLLSGYCKQPFRRMYWETKADTFNSLVSNSISRDRFEAIHRYLHFNDNNSIIPNNKTYKIQPLLDQINKVSQDLAQPLGKSYSLDEAMEPYFGKHHMKQFIRGKPIRYGFKFWCLTSPEGYLLKFNPYCGKGDRIEGKTLGSSVTETLCIGYLPEKSIVFVDNFFNSLPLMETLRANNIYCIGTIRSDRIENAPLTDLTKQQRGTSHVLKETKTNLVLIRWHDNSQVTVGTNYGENDICFTKGFCKRWSKQEKKRVDVDQPNIIHLYNQGMGGVDLFDKMRGLYRTRIRSRKWYWPFIRFCLNGAVVNMWILYRFAYPKTSLIQFIRRIVLSLLSSPNYLAGPKPKCTRSILHEVRFDGVNHLVDKQATQRRCAHCRKCTKFSCVKCNIGLHPDSCFRMYHTPSK